MEEYRLIDIVMRNLRNVCIPGPSRDTITQYYLVSDFDRLLGTHVIDKSNGDVTLKKEFKNDVIEIKSIYTDSPIEIRISVKEDESVIIKATTDTGVSLFYITISNRCVTNSISFDDDLKSVYEYQEVEYNGTEANEFKLFRTEDDEVVYDGKLVPLLAANGDNEYFSFHSNMETSKKEETSILKKIVDSLNDQSIVKVTTSKEIHDLSEYVDSIFDTLREKLNSTRAVKDVKTRKRVPEKKK